MLNASRQSPPPESPICHKAPGRSVSKAEHAAELGVDPAILDKPAAWIAAHYSTATIDLAAKTGGAHVFAVANQGRWVAHCLYCSGATMVSPDDPRFMCVECGNAANDGLYCPVVWPDDWRGIEAVLDQRSDITTRNWTPPETLTGLATENVAHMPKHQRGDWSGHTHRWPKKRPAAGTIECLDCELRVHVDEAGRTADEIHALWAARAKRAR